MTDRVEKARNALNIAQENFNNAVVDKKGVQQASIALDDAVDEFFDAMEAQYDAQAIKSYLDKLNAPTDKENALNSDFEAL